MAILAKLLGATTAVQACLAGMVFGLLPMLLHTGRNLEYEYVWMVSVLTVMGWPLHTLISPVKPMLSRPQKPKSWLGSCSALFAGASLPGLTAFALKLSPCSGHAFVQWIILQTLPACFVAGAIHQTAGYLAGQHGVARPRLLLAWMAFATSALAIPSAILWFMPQKRIVDVFLGFIHGPVYDELIYLHRDIWMKRAGHLSLAIAMGLAAAEFTSRPKRLISVSIPLLIWVIFTWTLRISPVTGHGMNILRKQFPAMEAGPGYTIYHGFKGDSNNRFMQAFRKQVDFHMHDLKANLQLKNYPAVQIYLYPDDKHKKLWFGGGATDITDVRNAGIHLGAHWHQPYRHPTLRHELVHALTSDVAFHGLGFHPNMALTEGLAVALAPEADHYGSMSMDQAASGILDLGLIPDPTLLFDPWSFWSFSGARAYTTAGSLIRFIIEQKGIKPIIEIYGGRKWSQAFGQNEKEIINSWRDFLRQNFHNDHSEQIQTRSLYRSAGIIRDICPHSFANKLAGNPDPEILHKMARVTGNPKLALKAYREEIKNIYLEFEKLDGSEKIRKIFEEIKPSINEVPADEEAIEKWILASDLQKYLDKGQGSLEPDLLDELINLHKSNPLPPRLARHVLLRKELRRLAQTGAINSLQASQWQLFLAGIRTIPEFKPRSTEPQKDHNQAEPWIMTYLRLREAYQTGTLSNDISNRSGLKATDLIRSSQIEPDAVIAKSHPSFEYEWNRSLAALLEMVGKFDLAPAFWAKAAKLAPNSTARTCMLENKRFVESW
jgi:hypothetical protein